MSGAATITRDLKKSFQADIALGQKIAEQGELILNLFAENEQLKGTNTTLADRLKDAMNKIRDLEAKLTTGAGENP